MTIPEMYDYLVRARRDLWTALEAAPPELLAHALLDGPRFHCVKDLLFHLAEVEDGWLNGDIRGTEMVLGRVAALKDTTGGPVFADVPLEVLRDYWRLVERGTLEYLASLTDAERARVVAVDDSGETRHTVDGLLWHVMLHEVRHTAQIVVLLRAQGVAPPALDLLWYLPQV